MKSGPPCLPKGLPLLGKSPVFGSTTPDHFQIHSSPGNKEGCGPDNPGLFSRRPNRFGGHAHNVSNSLGNPADINRPGLQPIFPLECLLGLTEYLLHKFTIAKDTLIPLLECTCLPQGFQGGPSTNAPNQSPNVQRPPKIFCQH